MPRHVRGADRRGEPPARPYINVMEIVRQRRIRLRRDLGLRPRNDCEGVGIKKPQATLGCLGFYAG